jgi:putative sigma-54 modulation protein
MRLDITGRQVTVTPPLRQLITRRLARLERLLNDAAISAVIILTKEKYRLRTELAVHTRGDRVLSGNGEASAWPVSVRAATDAVEQQAQKLKGKWDDRRRKGAGARAITAPPPEAAEPAGPRIIRNRRYTVKPMSLEDAAMQVEEGPETFVVFRNAESDAVTILYRRKDGNFGLIEPE